MTTAAANGTRAPREGRQPAAFYSKANKGAGNEIDVANYPFLSFPADCPFQPGDGVQVADEDTGEVFTGRVVAQARLVNNSLRIGVLFEDNPNMRMVPVTILTARLMEDEQTRLEQHEQIIERGQKAFIEVGNALKSIQQSRLYRATHGTFVEYLRERWDLKETRAYEFIASAGVVNHLSEISEFPPPQVESHAAPLAKLAPDEQELVWRVVSETAPGGKVTGSHVKSVVEVLKEIATTGALDNGEGESIPVERATVGHLKAVVTETTYEREKRMREHIEESARRKQARLEAKAQADEIVLHISVRDHMGCVWLEDQHGNMHARMEVNPPFDIELAKRLVKAFNEGAGQS